MDRKERGVQSAAAEQCQADPRVSSILGFMELIDRDGFSLLHKCLLNSCFASLTEQNHEVRSRSTVLELLNSWALSKRGMYESSSSNQDCGYKKFSQNCIRAASATLHASGILVYGMLRTMLDSCTRFQGILCVRKFRYDETPMKSRVKSWNVLMEQMQSDLSDHAKLMQVEFTLWCLYKDLVSNDFVTIETKVPCQLQAVERTTGKCTKRCLTNVMKNIPNFPQCVEKDNKFKWLLHMTCTDRYNANLSAEKMLAMESPKWSKANFFCDVHRVAQAQIQTTDLFPEDTNGMLAVALFQRDMGAIHRLREMLADILVSNLQVVYGSPPEQPHSREELYDVLLPLPSKMSRGRKDSKTIVRMQQRFILTSMLNGNIESDSIVHYCEFNCCRSWGHTVEKMRRFVVWSLIPHKCPKFVKSRWTGHETALTWNALLMCHHNLHERLLVRYTGVAERLITPSCITPAVQAIEDEQDWSFLMDVPGEAGEDLVLADDPLHDLQLADRPVQEELLEEFSAAVKSAEEAFDASVAQKRAFKKKAGLWSQSRPLPRLLIMSDVMMVIRSLIHQCFFWQVQNLKGHNGHAPAKDRHDPSGCLRLQLVIMFVGSFTHFPSSCAREHRECMPLT